MNASTTQAAYAFSSPSDCLISENLVVNPIGIAARIFHLCLICVILCLFVRLLREFKLASVTFHGNLTLLFANVMLVYLLYCFATAVLQIRYFVLYCLARSLQPCSMLTPFWVAMVERLPQYFHLIAMPLLHFVIMAERSKATLFSADYEREGKRYAIIALSITWLLSLAFVAFIALTSLCTYAWDATRLLIFPTLVTPANASVVLSLHYAILALIGATIFADWRIFVLNRAAQQQKRTHPTRHDGYNLSQVYQISENVVVMRLILPLDISYAVLFLIFICCSTVIRNLPLSMENFQIAYDWANSLMLLHALITFGLYGRFIREGRCRRKSCVQIASVEKHGELYFKQLRAQWRTQQ